MSQIMEEGPLREAAILTKAVENVFRKLIRLLVGRMSLVKIQEMMRIVYIDEAQQKIQRENPGKGVPLTNLALLTGLDTRTLSRITKSGSSKQPIHLRSDFIKGFSPGFKVLDLWLNDLRFLNEETGEPLELAISGGEKSFEFLVSQAIPARGITSQSMLDRLIENEMVIVNKATGSIFPRKEGIVFIGNDELDMIDIGLSAVANLISTISHNVDNSNVKSNRFFQRNCWTFKLSESNKVEFRENMRDFLAQANKNAKYSILPYEEDKEGPNQITAGIGMYYYEELPDVS